MDIEGLERRSIEVRVADLLRRRFLAGGFTPGERLTEEGLAKALSVSRGPVRAALQRLEREHLVVLKPYCGWEVAKPTPQDVWEVKTLRCGLEELGARLAASRIDSLNAKALRAALDGLNEACVGSVPADIVDMDFALHRLIIEQSGNGRLQRAYLQLEYQVRFLISAVNTPYFDEPVRIARSHNKMIEAICAGDADAAANQCREHARLDPKKLARKSSRGVG